jgi:hypothetical protein
VVPSGGSPERQSRLVFGGSRRGGVMVNRGLWTFASVSVDRGYCQLMTASSDPPAGRPPARRWYQPIPGGSAPRWFRWWMMGIAMGFGCLVPSLVVGGESIHLLVGTTAIWAGGGLVLGWVKWRRPQSH